MGASALPQLLSDGGETTPADVGVVAPVVVEPLGLSSGAFDLFGNIQTSFSCEGRIYGYYANVELFCQIFHVCQPVTYADGEEELSSTTSSVPTRPCSTNHCSPVSTSTWRSHARSPSSMWQSTRSLVKSARSRLSR